MKRLIFALVFCASCGGSGDGGGGGGGNSLAGTWQFFESSNGAAVGSMTLSSSHLTVIISNDELDLGTDGTFAWRYANGGNTPLITATHNAGAFDPGAASIGLGGDWTFDGSGGHCSASIQPASMLGSCAGVGYPPDGIPDLNRHATAMRTQKLDSIFGDLGGTWTITDDRGGNCMATLQGSTLSFSCASNGSSSAGLQLTVGDGVVSGATDSGFEFSARRQ